MGGGRRSPEQWVEKGGQDQVGGASDEVVKKAESAGELVMKAESADEKRSNGPATHPYRSCGMGRGRRPEAMCRHPNRALWLGLGQHTALP